MAHTPKPTKREAAEQRRRAEYRVRLAQNLAVMLFELAEDDDADDYAKVWERIYGVILDGFGTAQQARTARLNQEQQQGAEEWLRRQLATLLPDAVGSRGPQGGTR